MKNKYKIWIIAALVLSFAAGFFGGIVGERYIIQRRQEIRASRYGHFPSMNQMAKALNLTEEQQKRINEIMQKNEERMKETGGRIHELLDANRAQLKSEIDAVLTPEQIKNMEDMIEKYRAPRPRNSGERYPGRNDRPKEKRSKPS